MDDLEIRENMGKHDPVRAFEDVKNATPANRASMFTRLYNACWEYTVSMSAQALYIDENDEDARDLAQDALWSAYTEIGDYPDFATFMVMLYEHIVEHSAKYKRADDEVVLANLHEIRNCHVSSPHSEGDETTLREAVGKLPPQTFYVPPVEEYAASPHARYRHNTHCRALATAMLTTDLPIRA
ncbi:MAG: hypothetical protein AAB592_05745 [Patescibacteria group bacterium]